MREIKFRAFLRSDQRLSNGIALGYEKYPKGIYEVMELNFANETATLWSEKEQTCFEASFRKIELMQYTGRNDANGVEIYDGHIVKFHSGEGGRTIKGIVEFDDNSCFYACEVGNYLYPFMTTFGFKVIGNIYENPELLKDR